MKILPAIAIGLTGLILATPLHAHRLEGLVQSSLVEVLPSQVGVQVTLIPGMDIAPKIIAVLDRDGDGVFSEIESDAWAELFMARQRVTVDGKSLPLTLQSVRASPLAEMTGGHAEIAVHFTAELGALARGPRTITCANRYEPIPSAYQVNGLIPKSPDVRISSHRRDERQQELTLAAEFSDVAVPVGKMDPAKPTIPPKDFPKPVLWLAGLSLAGGCAAICGRWRRVAVSIST